MADSGKLLSQLADRISYLVDIKGNSEYGNIGDLLGRVQGLRQSLFEIKEADLFEKIDRIEDRVSFLEDRVAEKLSPAEIVNIVRSPQRFTLMDILENVYEQAL
jgi:acetyl-CoA carboxylase carboxyl transferase subunit beta